jgi:uncharacterized protein (UPF0332 family)
MIDQKRIADAERNVKRYVQEGLLFLKRPGIAGYSRFFLSNAETSLLTAKTLFEISSEQSKKQTIMLPETFESYLWVVVSSYYSMFYSALALLGSHQIKVGDKVAHKVVADTLISQYLSNKRLAKLIDAFEDERHNALELIGAEEKASELVESFEQERLKRHRLQYELGAEAKRNLAKTSLDRATAFVAEIRNILRETNQKPLKAR